jgi:hypothetical protein
LGENCLKEINGLMREKLERFDFLWSIVLCCKILDCYDILLIRIDLKLCVVVLFQCKSS